MISRLKVVLDMGASSTNAMILSVRETASDRLVSFKVTPLLDNVLMLTIVYEAGWSL